MAGALSHLCVIHIIEHICETFLLPRACWIGCVASTAHTVHCKST